MRKIIMICTALCMIASQASGKRYNISFGDNDSKKKNLFNKKDDNNDMKHSKRMNSLITNGHGVNVVFRLINENNSSSLNDIMMRYPFRKSEFSSTGYHVLSCAIFNKNINMLKSLSKNFSSSLALDPQKNNAVHLCTMMEWEEGLEYLLSKGHNSSAITAKNMLGKTPFDIAKASRNRTIIDMLSKYNRASKQKSRDSSVRFERVNLNDDDEEVSHGNANAFKTAGYDKAFMYVLNKDEEKILRELSKTITNKLDKYNNNIFHILVLFGHYEMIEKIISEVDKFRVMKAINAQNFLGNTPMHIAASMNDERSVQALLECPDVDLSVLNSTHISPLMIPIRNYGVYQWEKANTRKIMYSMIQYEPNDRFADHFYAHDNYGNTVFHLAAMQGIVKLLITLILHGFDVNTRNNNGETGADKLGVGIYRAESNDKLYAMYNFIKHLEDGYRRGDHTIGNNARKFLEEHGIQLEKYMHEENN